MFQFPGFALPNTRLVAPIVSNKWVAPFGYLGINGRSHLPLAFRS